jgi:hypothetical protein
LLDNRDRGVKQLGLPNALAPAARDGIPIKIRECIVAKEYLPLSNGERSQSSFASAEDAMDSLGHPRPVTIEEIVDDDHAPLSEHRLGEAEISSRDFARVATVDTE